MKRVKLVVAYDGTAYHGWQVQPNGRTIEGELNRALSELLQEDTIQQLHRPDNPSYGRSVGAFTGRDPGDWSKPDRFRGACTL